MKLKIMRARSGRALAAARPSRRRPPSDTLPVVLAKGATMNVAQMGVTGDVAYKPDGTFSGFDGQYEGTYKVDGTKLCFTAAGGRPGQCLRRLSRPARCRATSSRSPTRPSATSKSP